MPIVGQFSDVQQHGSKNICTLIKGSNGQISHIYTYLDIWSKINIALVDPPTTTTNQIINELIWKTLYIFNVLLYGRHCSWSHCR